MKELAFCNGLSSAEWAAWVQAICSVVAIIATGGFAIYQSRSQYKTAMGMYQIEKRHAHLEMARAIGKLASNCRSVAALITSHLIDPDSIEDFARSERHLDIVGLKSLEQAMASIPLIGLPEKLVSEPLILHAAIRQFREYVESYLNNWNKQYSINHSKFIEILDEIKGSIEVVCDTIAIAVAHVEANK